MAMRINIYSIGMLIAAGIAVMLAGCMKKVEESAEYKAVCEGLHLSSTAKRNQAMEDGYIINKRFDCVDKASYAAVKEERMKYEAANTPEAIAKQKAEFAEKRKRYEEELARKAEVEKNVSVEAESNFVFRIVEVNTATEDELASVASIRPEVAAQIIAARQNGLFHDWYDLVNRVIGMSAAQSVAYASVSGLTVNGKSMEGAPPDERIAAAYWKNRRQ